jgi:IS30 family transposase
MNHINQEQRYTIQVLLEQNFSKSHIATVIGKDKTTIYRELKRNSDKRNFKYTADLATKKCNERPKNKNKKIHFTDEIKQKVEEKIKEDYSPEQITGYFKKEGITCISHERIYQHIWQDKKKKGDLYTHLRTQGKKYRKRGAGKDKRGQIIGRVDIENRPEIVEEKTRFGDFEIDLVIGKNHKKAILTANDRATGFTKIALLESKSAEEVKEKTIEILKNWKPFLQTITSDNGKEFAKHQEISKELEVNYYFAKPYHSWERGANENYNGLLRQYFPKDYDFNLITEKELKYVEEKLNNRPRKKFGYLTPNEVYLQTINNNGKVAFMT